MCSVDDLLKMEVNIWICSYPELPFGMDGQMGRWIEVCQHKLSGSVTGFDNEPVFWLYQLCKMEYCLFSLFLN